MKIINFEHQLAFKQHQVDCSSFLQYIKYFFCLSHSELLTRRYIYQTNSMQPKPLIISPYILKMCSVRCLLVCVVCVIEPGPNTKGLGILILFGGGRYWSKEYQKNSRKFKICIIMHKYAKLVICSIGSLLLCWRYALKRK